MYGKVLKCIEYLVATCTFRSNDCQPPTLSLCALILILVDYLSIFHPIAISNFIGMILSIFGGIAFFVYSKQSYWLTKKIALLRMILPLFFSQESIMRIGPERTAVVTGLILVMSYVMIALYTHTYEIKMFLLCSIITIMIGLSEILSKRQAN